jgi:hypothetical protein
LGFAPPTRRRRLLLVHGGVYLGIVAGDPETHRHFADTAQFSVVEAGWTEIFMAQPSFRGLSLFAGEAVLEVLRSISAQRVRS